MDAETTQTGNIVITLTPKEINVLGKFVYHGAILLSTAAGIVVSDDELTTMEEMSITFSRVEMERT